MIESRILDTLRRTCPNYHIVSEKFAKQSFSICVCSKCRSCIDGRHYGSPSKEGFKLRCCKRLMDALGNIEAPYGYATVCEFGTCDAAQFTPEDYSDFKLQQEQTQCK